MDTEYIRLYTAAHQEMAGQLTNATELRAECHARALEQLTPVIDPNELFVGRKTRDVRGSIPYCNYASTFILREFEHQEQEAQDSLTEVGAGGGIEAGRAMAEANPTEYRRFGKKMLIRQSEVVELKRCAEYWATRNMQAVGDRLWKTSFDQAAQIENGWKAVLYTAAHDPAPEGRNILDFETALGKGLNQIAQECETRAKQWKVTDNVSAESVYFWRAAARVLRAVVVWAANYAKEATRIAQTVSDPVVKARLLKIAEICQRVPGEPPRDFEEAIQGYWLVYCAGHLEGAYLGYSPGRFDQYMLPWFAPDFKSGKLTKQRAVDLLAFLRLKMTEMEYVSSFAWEGLGSGNLFQNMILGGLTESGAPADNELSLLVIEAAIACKTTQPTLSVWYDERLSDKFLMKAAECVKTGVGFPAWFNFKCYAQHEMDTSGTPLSVIRKYAAMGGCTEPVLGGMSYGVVQAGFVNLVKVFELALYGGKDPRTGTQMNKSELPQTYEELMTAFEFHLGHSIKNWQSYWNYVMAAHRQTCVMVFASALTRDCIGRGKSLDDGGAFLNNTPTTLSTGMVNVANSMAAVKSLLNSKTVSLDQLRTALTNNWKNAEELRAQCLRAPKWGNDDDRVDDIFVQLFNKYCDIVKSGINYLGKPYDPSMLAISTHAPFGRACFATPDGRQCGETLADGVTSPHYGTDTSGPFSVLRSAQKVDHTRIRGGLHNMKIHPASIKGASGSRKLLDLIGAYFRSSQSFQLQFNVVDTAVLRDAQAHPENYRDLIVRVAGFSAYFVELARPIQDEVIARTEYELGGSTGACDDVEEDPTVISAAKGTVFNVQDFALHDGPGVRTTVFMKGCPLRCTWCANPEGQSYDVEDQFGSSTTAGELVAQVMKNVSFHSQGGGVTLSGGEPLAQPAFAYACAKLLAMKGVNVAVETAGAWRWDDVKEAVKLMQLVYYDLKAVSTDVCTKYISKAYNPAANLRHVVNELGAEKVIVSVPIVPGVNSSAEECKKIAAMAWECGARKVRLLPYHALGSAKYEKLGRKYEMFDLKPPTESEIAGLKMIFEAQGLECAVGM